MPGLHDAAPSWAAGQWAGLNMTAVPIQQPCRQGPQPFHPAFHSQTSRTGCRQQPPPQRRMQEERIEAPRVMARSASNDYLGPQGQGVSLRPGGGPAAGLGRGGPSRDASPSCAPSRVAKVKSGCLAGCCWVCEWFRTTGQLRLGTKERPHVTAALPQRHMPKRWSSAAVRLTFRRETSAWPAGQLGSGRHD